MTLEDLRGLLNGFRTDPVWLDLWRSRGIEPANVLSCLRAIFHIAARHHEHVDLPRFHYYADVAVRYARGEYLESPLPAGYSGPRGPGMPKPIRVEGDPAIDENEAKAEWVSFIKAVNRNQTYAQAIAFFQRKFGYWPRRRWPGMPLYEMDRLARIAAVPPEKLIPFSPEKPLE